MSAVVYKYTHFPAQKLAFRDEKEVRSPSQCISEYGLLVAELDESELTSPDTVTDVEGLALLDNVKT